MISSIIEEAFEKRDELTAADIDQSVRPAVEQALHQLETGQARVAEPADGGWVVNEWLKKAVLLYFRINDNRAIPGGHTSYYDKVPCRWGPEDPEPISASGARVVPPATVRRGAARLPRSRRGRTQRHQRGL